MNKKNIVIVVIILIILCIIFKLTNNNTNMSSEKNTQNNNSTIGQIKNDVGATANENLYKIQIDNNGRGSIEIKDEVLFNVAIAGILNNQEPTYESLDETINKQNISNGIWISFDSRDDILLYIKKYLKDEYYINDEGYLKLKNTTKNSNNLDKKLQKCIENDKTYIISTKGEIYTVDNITGEIQLYPFEEMDAYQLCEPVEYNNKKIIVLSSNKQKKLEDKELLEAMIEQMNI